MIEGILGSFYKSSSHKVSNPISFIEFRECLHKITNRLISCYSIFEDNYAYSFKSVCSDLYNSKEITKKERNYMLMYFIKINGLDKKSIHKKGIKYIFRCLNSDPFGLYNKEEE